MPVTAFTAPAHCKPTDDLTGYFYNLVEKSKASHGKLFCSISYKTTFSDPLALLESLHRPENPHCYFEKSTDEFSIACGEYLAQAEFQGADRFQHAKIWSDTILQSVERAGDAPLAGTGPTIFLNATFESEQRHSGLPALSVFLPRWQVINQRGQHFIVLNTEIRPDSNPEQIQAELMGRLKSMIGLTYEQSNPAESKTFPLGKSKENFDYIDGVTHALDEISSGRVSKIVLARQLTFDVQRKLCPFSIAHGLRAKFPDCHAFSLSAPNHGTWVGASPETLAHLSGNKLRTEALAGSAPRGLSAGKDAHWGKTLLAREKEVHEHNLVIESIHRRLASVGVSNLHQGLPRLLRLANLQHVRTPVKGNIPSGLHPFEILSALHPTPAMGGSPRLPALTKLAEIEKHPRGWYSGVAGWMDSRGRAEFIVPIRCGRLFRNSLTLYAGAGIVDGSIPAHEKQETDWKLQAMLEVITGSPNLPG